MSIVDAIFDSARRDLDSPYRLWYSVYYSADDYPLDEKLQCLYDYLRHIFLAEHENRSDDLKKQGAEEYVFIDDESDHATILNALDGIEQHINNLYSNAGVA